MQLQRATCHMRSAVRLMQLQWPEVHKISGELAKQVSSSCKTHIHTAKITNNKREVTTAVKRFTLPHDDIAK